MGHEKRQSDRPIAIVLFQGGKQTHKCNLGYWQTVSDLTTFSQNSNGTDKEI